MKSFPEDPGAADNCNAGEYQGRPDSVLRRAILLAVVVVDFSEVGVNHIIA